MAQNIYDDASFFSAYSQLPRSIDGLGAAAEWPTMQTLLPTIAGSTVVDLGCGFGWFCRWARGAGATSVVGVDLSENMLARARTDTTDPAVTYQRADLDALELPVGAFDLAYSSLALHYLVNLDALLATVHASLSAGGRFVFSVEHPLFTAPSSPAFVEHNGGVIWPLDRYLDEGPRTTDWLAPGVVKQHRTIGAYVRSLVAAGFVLDALVEWGPSAAQIAEHPEWAVEVERPPFLLVAARRS